MYHIRLIPISFDLLKMHSNINQNVHSNQLEFHFQLIQIIELSIHQLKLLYLKNNFFLNELQIDQKFLEHKHFLIVKELIHLNQKRIRKQGNDDEGGTAETGRSLWSKSGFLV